MQGLLPLMVEAALITLVIMALHRRKRFISRYPELRKFYDYSLLGFIAGASAKLVFLSLDFMDHHIISLSEGQVSVISNSGNLLFLMTVVFLFLGWAYLLKVLERGYELVPVVEFKGEEYEHLKPGLYLCHQTNCYPMVSKLLRGRAGLIISRRHPEEIRKILKIEKTPVLWLSKVREETPSHRHASNSSFRPWWTS